MEELTLTTPALLFSAVSLILLAYTNVSYRMPNLCANCVTATWKTLRISLKRKSRIYGNG